MCLALPELVCFLLKLLISSISTFLCHCFWLGLEISRNIVRYFHLLV